ncbi:restriction endonuclease subunit S [Pantoea eucrina]|uniref:restriction endonuclease subunit S n=1 Tax=Pantoea eucrina TaxID=472693 RepID=UPI0024B78D7B|nr:restriction endonuclease subunit S [Pantoea eucrina]MDJ0022710.1 restriction endonuclease subunit S [Pantoea eucrina]
MSAGKLPEGWVDTQLGNVIEYGKTSKKDLSDVNGETWVLGLEDMEKDSSKILNKVIASNRPFKSTKNSFNKGDVLYGKLRPYLNKIIMANDDGVCTTEIIPINAEPACCNKYLFFWLKISTFLGYVSDVSYGVNMPRLGTSDGLKAPLLLAPLAKQKIIAEKLDTLLAQVDSTKARLEQKPKILKRFRQAVLAAAISGKLVNNENNKAGLTTLGSIAEDIRYGTSKKCSESEGHTPVLRVPNIGRGYVINNNMKYADFDSKELSALTLKEGDLLFIRSNGSIDLVGKVAVISENDIQYLYAGYLIRIRLRLGKAVPKYVSYCLQSPQLRQIIENIARSTSGVNNIKSKELASLDLPHPTISEQTEIVRRIEQIFAYADTIEKQVVNALSRANNLTQSILAKAFQGELTAEWRAENPELISGENSAAALLEKIKAERAASTGKKASRKKS